MIVAANLWLGFVGFAAAACWVYFIDWYSHRHSEKTFQGALDDVRTQRRYFGPVFVLGALGFLIGGVAEALT